MSNLLPLYTFFEIVGFNPWHAFGIAGTGALAVSTNCDTLIRRYEWQNSDATGAAAVAQAIGIAEARLADELGYSPAPHYVTETRPWPARADGWLRTGAWQSDGRWLNVQLSEGEVRAVGVETLTAISAGAAVVYSDTDGDGIDDTFTVTAATTVTDTGQIAVYYAAADRFSGWGSDSAVGERWRLLPVRVTITGGAVTVTGPKQLCVKPIRYEGVTNIGASGLDPDVAANFVTTLDLYRRYTNADGTTAATSQGLITWETRPSYGWWNCCGSVDASTAYAGSLYDPAATAVALARVGIRDARAGLVAPAEAAYDATTGKWESLDWTVCDQPDRVTVRYLAGYPLGADGQMQEPYRTIVARMAAAELARPICGCDSANRELYRWQFDLSQTARGDELFAISPEDLNNPFGTRRGHVWAWKQVQGLRQLRGFLA